MKILFRKQRIVIQRAGINQTAIPAVFQEILPELTESINNVQNEISRQKMRFWRGMYTVHNNISIKYLGYYSICLSSIYDLRMNDKAVTFLAEHSTETTHAVSSSLDDRRQNS